MVKLTVHSVGRGECVLSEKEAEGMVITFEDGTVTESFLATKSLVQLLRMKLGVGNGKSEEETPIATPLDSSLE